MKTSREKLNRLLDAKDKLEGVARVDITMYHDGSFFVFVMPPSYDVPFTEESRHKVLAVLTPLVGKMTSKLDGVDKGFEGRSDGISIFVRRADRCEIVGYKKVKKTIQKEIEREPEYETVEEEIQMPITDCDIRQGRYKESDIEVAANNV